MISESKFYMWRAIFSLAHADGIVVECEKRFMEEQLETLSLSLDQREILQDDMVIPQDTEDMFLKITNANDRSDFFTLARNLAMADGDYHASEQSIMAKVQKLQVSKTDIDGMVGKVGLEFEEKENHKREIEEKKGFFSFLRRKKED